LIAVIGLGSEMRNCAAISEVELSHTQQTEQRGQRDTTQQYSSPEIGPNEEGATAETIDSYSYQ
jgi:hypothetical protein